MEEVVVDVNTGTLSCSAHWSDFPWPLSSNKRAIAG